MTPPVDFLKGFPLSMLGSLPVPLILILTCIRKTANKKKNTDSSLTVIFNLKNIIAESKGEKRYNFCALSIFTKLRSVKILL
jgi:hypothetical protein